VEGLYDRRIGGNDPIRDDDHGNPNPPSSADRRDLLRYLGGVGLVFLAGCIPGGKTALDRGQGDDGSRIAFPDGAPGDLEPRAESCTDCTGTCTATSGGNCASGCTVACGGNCTGSCTGGCSGCSGVCMSSCTGGSK
jgi:hypothetical protein